MFRIRWFYIFVFCSLLLVLKPEAVSARIWSYGVTEIDTPVFIDLDKSNVDIDTENNEIRLPLLPVSNAVQFFPDGGYSYAVLTETGVKVFHFDGTKMVENDLLSINIPDPLSMALPLPFPDIVVANENGITHYNFTGFGMIENPALSVAGLSSIISIGSTESQQLAVLTETEVKQYRFGGTNMVEIPMLGLSLSRDAIGLAMAGTWDFAILEDDAVKYFSFDGTKMVENPLLSVAGLVDPVAFSVASPGDVAVVEGTEVKHYSFKGGGMVYNTVLSITENLEQPSAVAIRPGTYDRLIVDGDKVQYYSFNGKELVYNPYLSVVVADIAKGTNYRSKAVLQSVIQNYGWNIDMIRVTANIELPAGTSITWWVTADGNNWTEAWRAKGEAHGTVVEVMKNGTWEAIGDKSIVRTGQDVMELWVDVEPGDVIQWRAELATADRKQTPVIKGLFGEAIRWEVNARPKPPVIITPEDWTGWFYTTTPTFLWNYIDPDEDDYQTAFQVEVRSQLDDSLVLDSGKIIFGESTFTLPTSQVPEISGPLWSSGEYAFYIQIRVWDSVDAESPWSEKWYFKVLAFERPRLKEIINPPAGHEGPEPSKASTHIMIRPGMTKEELPRVKAGARVTVLLDSVGPITDEADVISLFPYLERLATIDEAKRLYDAGSKVNRWELSIYTEASLKDVPTGTVVNMITHGTGIEGGTTVFVLADDDKMSEFRNGVKVVSDDGIVDIEINDKGRGIEPFAEGLFVTEGSIFEDWLVVLEGSER